MTLELLVPFIAIAAVAGYFQTVTGFGLGMIVIGATSGLNVAPVASVAAVVSLMMLANSAVALPGKLRHLNLGSIDTFVGSSVSCAAGQHLQLTPSKCTT